MTGRIFRRAVAPALALFVLWPATGASQSIADPDSVVVSELEALVRQASPELRARGASLSAAEARVRGAGSYGPVLLSAELDEVPDGLDVGQAGNLRLDLSREIFSGGLPAARRSLASRAAERARRELALARRSLRARIDDALARYLGGVAVSGRLAAQDSLLVGAQEAVTSRFAVGAARYVDVLRLRTERLRTQVEAGQARTEALQARRSLVGLVGPEDSLVAVFGAKLDRLALRASLLLESFSFPGPPALDSLVAASASVQLGEVAVQQADAGVRLAKASQRTRVNLSLGVQRFEDGTNGHRVGPTLGASMTLPFTARGAGRATIEAAEQEKVASTAGLMGNRARTTAVLGAARDRYQAALANARLFEASLLEGAREERENALAGYRAGSMSLLELLDFERALTQAEISRTRSLVAAAEALAALLAGTFEVPEPTGPATDLSGGGL